jgi:signal transduction histidine kinase
LSVTPFRNESGELKGFSVIIQDISELKKIEQERLKLQEKLQKYNEELEARVKERTLQLQELNAKLEKEIQLNYIYERQLEKSRHNLLEAQKLAGIGDWEINFITEEVIMSHECYRILELDRNTVPDFQTLLSIISTDAHSTLDIILENVKKQGELHFDKEIVLNNGKVKILNIIIKFLLNEESKIKGLFGTLHDITLRKKAEEEINRALEKEKEINQIKERFTWMISHEFRTPLTVIQSNLQLLEKFGENTPEDKKKEMIQKGLAACKKIESLLDDILQVGKMKERKVELQLSHMNLVDFTQTLVEELSISEYGNDRIVFLHSDKKLFDCEHDKKTLRKIFTNLLNNALKYSPRDKKVELNLELENENFVITVKDEGIGIPKEDISKIFENFYRSSNVGTTKGSGIGLALVKEYIDILGGRVEVESILGQGSIFRVFLPKKVNKGLLT